MMGVAMFLLLLLFAVQVLFGLYATTVVNAAAFDAAASVAAQDGDGVSPAEATARRHIGALAGRATFTWALEDDAVRLTVVAPRPRLLDLAAPDIRRTVRVRRERVR
ncbi:MAG: hypothetical protein LC792_17475 [Actinobacteria bacterium]|nr:hypothetical protein [Actinomycetota bacterium]